MVGGEGDDRGWDGWMASPTRWTLVWVNSGSWWWTGRPDMLWSMGSQRVGHDWATELNWCPLSWSCHPTISSSVVLILFCLPHLPASEGWCPWVQIVCMNLVHKVLMFLMLLSLLTHIIMSSKCFHLLVPQCLSFQRASFFGRVQVPFSYGRCELLAQVTHVTCQNDAWYTVSTAEHWISKAPHTISRVGRCCMERGSQGKPLGRGTFPCTQPCRRLEIMMARWTRPVKRMSVKTYQMGLTELRCTSHHRLSHACHSGITMILPVPSSR